MINWGLGIGGLFLAFRRKICLFWLFADLFLNFPWLQNGIFRFPATFSVFFPVFWEFFSASPAFRQKYIRSSFQITKLSRGCMISVMISITGLWSQLFDYDLNDWIIYCWCSYSLIFSADLEVNYWDHNSMIETLIQLLTS